MPDTDAPAGGDQPAQPRPGPLEPFLRPLLQRAGVTRSMTRLAEDGALQSVPFLDIIDADRSELVRILRRCSEEVAAIMVPSDGNGLFDGMLAAGQDDSVLVRNIVAGMRAATRGSIERRVLRACLCKSFPAARVAVLLASTDDGDDDDGETGDARAASLENVTASPSGTRRVTGGRGAASPPAKNGAETTNAQRDLPTAAEGTGEPDSTTRAGSVKHRDKRQRISGGFRRDFTRGRLDWSILVENGSLDVRKFTRAKVDDDTIRGLLVFLFRKDNSRLLSWGSIRIKKDGDWLPFPVLIRKISTEHVWRRYKAEGAPGDGAPGGVLGRTAFVNVVNSITRAESWKKTYMDSVLAGLVYDNVENLSRFVRSEVPEGASRDTLLDQLAGVQEYLEYSYPTHIGTDADILHCTDSALHAVRGDGAAEEFTSNCNRCLQPFQVLEDIRAAAGAAPAVHDVVYSAAHRFRLYLGHMQRAVLQEQRLASYFDCVRTRPPGTAAVVVLDHRMEFEPVTYRETPLVHFQGKLEIGWHGTVAFYRRSQSDGPSGSRENGEGEDLSNIVLDHIVRTGNTPDTWAVASVLDAALARLRLELPNVSSLWIVTTNARNFQNDLLPVMAPFISSSHNMRLESFIHQETTRGKSLVDAHFSIAMRHVQRYVKETRKDVFSPLEIWTALHYDGGVTNSTAELVDIARDGANVEAWRAGLMGTPRPMMKLGRVAEVVYGQWHDDQIVADCFASLGAGAMQCVFGVGCSRRAQAGEFDKDGPGATEGSSTPQVATPLATEGSHVEGIEYNGDESGEEGDHIQSVAIPSSNPAPPDVDDMEECEGIDIGVAFQGSVTGVTVRGRRDMRLIGRRRRIRASKALEDAAAEMEADGCPSAPDAEVLPREKLQSGNGQTLVCCSKCGRAYRRVDALSTHEDTCRGDPPNRQVLNRAAHITFSMLDSGEAGIYTSVDNHPCFTTLEVTSATRQRYKFCNGWGRRPKKGATLGSNTTMQYMPDIKGWFLAGAYDKRSRMSGAQMREGLFSKYPGRHDIPLEQHISTAIRKLYWKGFGRRAAPKIRVSRIPHRMRKTMPTQYADILRQLVDANRDMRPRDAKGLVVAELGVDMNELPPDFPDETSIRAKVSSLKTALRKA